MNEISTNTGQHGPNRPSADDKIQIALAQSTLQKQKKKKRKKQIKYAALGGAVLLLGYGIYLGLKPYTGSMAYGLCKVFLELHTRYPHTLYISTVEELGMSVRIWHTQIDSFGEYRMEPLQCYFKEDPTYGFALDKVTLRRRALDPALIADFNRTLGVILQNPPDLAMPKPLPDSLRDLQLDSAQYGKPLF